MLHFANRPKMQWGLNNFDCNCTNERLSELSTVAIMDSVSCTEAKEFTQHSVCESKAK